MFHVPGADELLRGSLLHMSDSKALAQWLTHNPIGRKLASRFVAGETLDGAIAAVRTLNSGGVWATLDHLGEAVTNPAEAMAAADEYVAILDRLHEIGAVDGGPASQRAQPGRETLTLALSQRERELQAVALSQRERELACNVSLKLTQMGLDISTKLCIDNLMRILDKAHDIGQFVRLDMESSRHTEDTLRVFEDVWGRGYRNVGIVLQAYLHRTEGDVERAIELGCRVRLCKGAYAEPSSVAFADKHETDANYLKLARRLLDAGYYPALATHDAQIIREVCGWQPEASSFEFQMLYGIRTDLQRQLVGEGYRVRAYVPFGVDWYAYFMRRLAERPANLMFFVGQLTR